MSWGYSFAETALRQLKKLDRQAQAEILRFLDDRVATGQDPERFGKPLSGSAHGLWRYRVRDYRIIAEIDRGQLRVLVVKVGHRSTVYD